MPVIIAVTIGIAVSKTFGPGVFSSIARANGLPFLDDLKFLKYDITAEQVMKDDFLFLTKTIPIGTVASLLLHVPDISVFPVVNSKGFAVICLRKLLN